MAKQSTMQQINRGQSKHGRMTDPTLREIRKARVIRDDAEARYAALCIDAIEEGFSYAQVANAGLTDKGSLHYYVRRHAKRMKRQAPGSKVTVGPANVEG